MVYEEYYWTICPYCGYPAKLKGITRDYLSYACLKCKRGFNIPNMGVR